MLSENQIAEIETEVQMVATAHLNAKDAETALSHFTGDVIAVSNTTLFSSRESLAVDIHDYYKILEEVNYAAWEDVHVHVINESAATFTARFRYGFTSIDGEMVKLRGLWTALFELDQGAWKIRLRHESFEQI